MLMREDLVISGNLLVVSSSVSVETPCQDIAYMGRVSSYVSGREFATLDLQLRFFSPVIERFVDPFSPELKSQIESLLLGGVDTSNQALMKKIYENMENRDA